MKKVCYHQGWLSCCDLCVSNGYSCVYITPTEKVVCWHTGFNSECNHDPICHTIDGRNVVIKDRDEFLYRTDGKPLQKRDRHDSPNCRIQNSPFQLGVVGPSVTPFIDSALIIMDMWDKHPGTGSSLRSSQLAPAINDFANFLRDRGCLIIHSPSERGVYSVKNPNISKEARQARQNAINAHDVKSGLWERRRFFYLGNKDLDEAFDHIITGAGEEWPTEPNKYTGQPVYQNPAIQIKENDAISATMLDMGYSSLNAYPELLALTVNRPNLIYCGIHANMCILARPNSMRTMAKSGKSLWIVRDLTDASFGGDTSGLTKYAADIDGSGYRYRFNSYNHFEGTDLVVDWIGRNVGAETWTSDFITGKPRFRFTGPFGDDPDRIWPREEKSIIDKIIGSCLK